MSGIAITERNLKFAGRSFFRGGAPEVQLGSFGEKNTSITKINRLEVQGHITIPKIKIKKATIVEIDFNKTTKKEFLADVKVAVVFKGSPETAYEDMVDNKLKLVWLTVENETVRKEVNDSPNVLDKLIKYGNDARVAGDIFVVMKAELAKTFESSNSIGLSVNAGIVKITAGLKLGSSGDYEYTMSPGSTFAYALLKPHWDANLKKNKTKIVKFTDDDQGL
jgi:hypothetical protein